MLCVATRVIGSSTAHSGIQERNALSFSSAPLVTETDEL